MKQTLLLGYVLLLATAALWGLAFAFQIEGMRHLGPYAFMAARFTLATIGMLPLIWLWPRIGPPDPQLAQRTEERRSWLWLGGLGAGVLMFAAAATQQHGLQYTTAGNAGFITALYVVLVPMLALLAGFRPGWPVFIGAGLALAGLYLLSFEGDFQLRRGDGLVLWSALFWALHMLWLGWIAPRCDALHMSAIQFAVCALISWVATGGYESIDPGAMLASWRALLYTGLVATSVCFTLQALAQQHVAPSHTALILCLESVFAALGGWWLLDETMGDRGMLGATVMLIGIAFAQLQSAQNPRDPTATVSQK